MLCTERVKEIYSVLHEMPELGFHENKTSNFIAANLVRAGYEVQTEVAGTGVIGILQGKEAGPVFAIRADMDALQHVDKVKAAVDHSAATVGANAVVTVKGGVPAAVYDLPLIDMARKSIAKILGEKGALYTIITPGGEDFHFFAQKIPSLR